MHSVSASRLRFNPPEEPLDVTLQSRRLPKSALPDDEDPPAISAQLADRDFVASDVVGELGHPERDVALGRVRVSTTTVSMPEAAVHEHNDSVAFQDDVRAPGQAPIVKPESIAQSVQDRADRDLGCRVAGSDPGHVPTTMG